MEKMFIVTASTGEYADKYSYNLFACASKQAADACLSAIDNWFQLQGLQKSPLKRCYFPRDITANDAEARHACADAFREQFGVPLTIDYTGVEFDLEEVMVFHDRGA